MLNVRRSDERGDARHGWLHSRHTFSFANYYDPKWMGFRDLRVINEDRVAPGRGFGTHPHRDMEIVSVVLEGALEHRDSMGHGAVIRPGEVQRMTAGTGVLHSEFNASEHEPVHFLQIWILPERAGLEPGYEQREFPADVGRNALRLVASRDGRDGSVTVHQDVELRLGRLDAGAELAYERRPDRHLWLQVVQGDVTVGDAALTSGDAAFTSDEAALRIAASSDAEVLLFDLA